MSERRTDRVREVLDLAMGRPVAERAAFVAGAAGGDEQVRAEVMSLLGALEGAGDALEPPLAGMAEEGPGEPLTGLSFGAYVVGERIGAGGMGVVYAAWDTRLGRTVAVKALPAGLARDPHRRARMEREARLLASLNHPNVAAIHGVADTDRGPVMILEHVPGRTLAEEIASRRLSVEEALGIARQVARGLEAAHGSGIVHRDLKPANIQVTAEGVVKILDFGVAKGTSGTGAEGGTGQTGATGTGMIVGTAAYMSPEQARRRAVDRRTDLWAFGCVVYEMLTGSRVFEGETGSDVAAAVLREEPDWGRLPGETPASVRRMLRRCLEKDAERRMRDAGDALLDLEESGEAVGGKRDVRAGRAWWLAACGAVAGVVVGAGLAWVWGERSVASGGGVHGGVGAAGIMRFVIPTGMMKRDYGGCAAISPDGRTVVWSADDGQGGQRLFRRRLDGVEAEAIEGGEGGTAPFFSPDGEWVGFRLVESDESMPLKRVRVDGGVPASMGVAYAMSASWGDDGRVAHFDREGRLGLTPASGDGETRLVPGVTSGAGEAFSQPEMLPGSCVVLVTRWETGDAGPTPRIEAVTLESGVRRVVVEDASQPRYAAGVERLLFYRDGEVMAATMELERLALTGEAQRVTGPHPGARTGNLSQYSVSRNGVVALVPWNNWGSEPNLSWYGVDGGSTVVYRGGDGIRMVRLSPDERRVALTTWSGELWVVDPARGVGVKLVDTGHCMYPVWTPDGTRIAFALEEGAVPARIAWITADGAGTPEHLFALPGETGGCYPTGFSIDGKTMLATVQTEKDAHWDVYLIDLNDQGERHATPLFPTRANRTAARFSPDGMLVSYASEETGRSEIYLVTYPGLERLVRVSIDGGERPTWDAEGKDLFFRVWDRLYTASVARTGAAVEVGTPRLLRGGIPGDRYDMSGDGRRLMTFGPREDWAPPSGVEVLIGW